MNQKIIEQKKEIPTCSEDETGLYELPKGNDIVFHNYQIKHPTILHSNQ